MNEEEKKEILNTLNIKIGANINDLAGALALQAELAIKRDKLQGSVSLNTLLCTFNNILLVVFYFSVHLSNCKT